MLAADVFSTDPPLAAPSKYTVLTDPKHITGFQNVAPIVTASVAKAAGSSFTETVNAVSAKLTLPAILAMNKAVEVDKKSAAVGGEVVPEAPTGSSSAMRVVVLGGGSSGEHFVGALRRLDAAAELTLVERRLVGGECSYWACMPTKTMLRAPELVAEARVRRGSSPGRSTRRASSPGAISSPSATTPRRSNGSTGSAASSSAATRSSHGRASWRSATGSSSTTGS